MKFLISFAAAVFSCVTKLRNFLFDLGLFESYKSSLPVISVGNIHVGGTGKTPFVRLLAQKAKEMGRNPIILSRGYGGSEPGPYRLRGGELSAEVGDEALIYSELDGLPVVVSRSRAEGAEYIEEHKLGDLILLDDGFQHRWLSRDFDFVLLPVDSASAVDSFVLNQHLPLGELREDRDRALRRANALVLSSKAQSSKPVSVGLDKLGIPVIDLNFSLEIPATLDRSKPLVAFCGIARPESFFSALENGGLELEQRRAFSDHHELSKSELAELMELSDSRALICTEKDWVRLPESARDRVIAIPLRAEVSEIPESFFELCA